jgi:hypothetical protein
MGVGLCLLSIHIILFNLHIDIHIEVNIEDTNRHGNYTWNNKLDGTMVSA